VEEFKTDGAVVFGGGGIAPDVVAGDTAAGRTGPAACPGAATEFRDALTAYAVSTRGHGR
jgi:hypothetical protein